MARPPEPEPDPPMNAAHKLLLIALPLAAAGLSYALHEGVASPLTGRAARDVQSQPTGIAREATTGQRARAEVRQGTFWAPAGSRFAFDLHSRIAMAVTTREGGAAERKTGKDLSHDGTLHLDVVARRERELVVAVSCPDLRTPLSAGDEDQPDLALNLAAAQQVTRIRMDEDGRILGYRFPTGTAMTQRNWLRGLYGSFGFVVPQAHGATWTERGSDSSGEFEAAYRGSSVEVLKVERVKQRYLQQAAATAMQSTLAGQAVAEIDVAAMGWLRSCQVDDTTHIASTEVPVEFDVEQHASLELKTLDFDASVIEDAFGSTDWASASGHTEDGETAVRERDLAERRAAVKGQTVASLNADLAALLAQSDSSRELYEAWRRACTLLGMDDEAVAAVARLLIDPSIDPKLASLWLSALADAGTPVAQSAVLNAFADEHLDAQVRGAAAGAMFDVRKPTPALVGGLSDHVAALNAIDGVDATAVLALGAFAQRDPSGHAAAAIESFEGRARTLGAEDLWIDAMANAKSGKLVDVASRAMNDECGFVRSAALRALGGVSDERALQALIRASRDDVDPAARSTALAQLATRSDAAAHEAILVAAETDSDAQVRDAALTALARGGVTAADRNRLEAIARNDAVEGLREFATRLLRGR